MDSREIALRIINNVETRQAYANLALAKEIGRRELSDQDRRFVTELVYGTVKAGNTLDWILGHYLTRSLDKVSPIIRNILRMGIYQIFFLSKIPVSAACNQSVELAKKYGHAGTVRFVNAVLRNASRNPEKVIYPNREQEPVRYLSLKYFHPEWMVARWVERLGIENTEQLCRLNNETPPLSMRTNLLKISRAELVDLLLKEGVVCTASHWTPEGIVCSEHPAIASLQSLRQGLFQVQDESSMLVAHVLDPKPGEVVFDVCGAPGGKSTHIAALMENKGRVLSADLYEHKLELIRENAKRLGITIIETKELDATQIGSLFPAQADRVLVDAPCSGLGVLRRKPDSRWRKNPAMLADLPKLQRGILYSAAQCVKPGGILVYSTCTTEPEENQRVVDQFLQQHPDFVLQNTGWYLPEPQDRAIIQLWPHVDRIDGFFIARMMKAKVGGAN
ncbi:Ribosomal RNA small subunit methyltransferase B [Propionispora sp. 2/2-37]|uniref:16S rRNA (cytosine(967)-C(5))-methyltransferase RsmB n=1 Tax=Propionispora sp. 2/2-37 TaxID=1677858 RepID=UPI0006BB76C1|nr:16S rRNA (cytosine(967)-C(5))-methyltransferase RsmB [Propionispora sp. 2/2-37]CUH94215.1 Ribosomal RNA small subunit methyltransferase B [Propionispora sp. 2/2-37]